MSGGQLLDDVRLAVEGKVPTPLHGRMGGGVPSVADIVEEIHLLV